MPNLRAKIETGFEQLAEIIYNHRIKTLLIMALLIGTLVAQPPKITFRYDLTDNLELTGGVILYQSGDLARFRRVGDNDRLSLSIKYSF